MTMGQTLPSSSLSRLGAAVSPGLESGGYGAVCASIEAIKREVRGSSVSPFGPAGCLLPLASPDLLVPPGPGVPGADTAGLFSAVGIGVPSLGYTRAKPKYMPVRLSAFRGAREVSGKLAVGMPSWRAPRPKPGVTVPCSWRG